MSVTITWLGHASFRIDLGGTTVYIDPWKIESSSRDGDMVLVSHSHYDHYSREDIGKVAGEDCTLVASGDVIIEEGSGVSLEPGKSTVQKTVTIQGIPAYNIGKDFHPRGNNWLGFVVEAEGKRIYYAGDTDVTNEMKDLGSIDCALLPVGGTYTMDAGEAAAAASAFKPGIAVPYHWGDIVGSETDAETFSKGYSSSKIVHPGESINV
jgi:L-ascorbate metabolism protein UlaG (beta-lactamase superfamily)